MPRIFLSPPHMGGEEEAFVREAFATNWIAPVGPHVEAFERELCAATGLAHAAAVSSGTAALDLALRLAGVRPGDEVIVPTLTFIATVGPAVHMGATPVFVDVDPRTWTLDPDLLGEALDDARRRGARVGAVVPVDLYGECADYARIEPRCAAHGVPVVTDAAEAVGSTRDGRPAGSFGRCGALSFNGNKIVTTSGGGAVVSDDGELVARARFLATQARDPAPHYEHSVVGHNHRLSNVLAGIGRGQLRVLADRVAARRRIHEGYRRRLGDLPGVAFQEEAAGSASNRWITCVLLGPASGPDGPAAVRRALEEADIEARPPWKPLHRQPVFRGARAVLTGAAESIFARGICLPSGSALGVGDLDRIAAIVRSVVAR